MCSKLLYLPNKQLIFECDAMLGKKLFMIGDGRRKQGEK
jgi:hypothetical protein